MLNIPDEIKQLLKNDNTRKNFRVHFPNGEHEDITNSNIVEESVSYSESICSQKSLVFGLFETPYIEFETFDVGNIKGCTIECILEVECDPDILGSMYQPDINMCIYPIPYGTFVVDTCKKQSDMTHRQVVAYSKMIVKNWEDLSDAFSLLSNKNFVWHTKNVKVSADALAKILTLDENQMIEPEYTRTEKTHTLGNGKVIHLEYKSANLIGTGTSSYNKSLVFKCEIDRNFIREANAALLQNSDGNYDYNILPTITYRYDYIWYYGDVSYLNYDYVEKDSLLKSDSLYVVPFRKLQEEVIAYDYDFYLGMGYTWLSTRAQAVVPTRLYITNGSKTIYDSGTHDSKIRTINEPISLLTFSGNAIDIKAEKSTTYIEFDKKRKMYRYDFSKLFEMSVLDFIQSYCELKGKFGKTNREGFLEIVSIKDNFENPNAGVLRPQEYSSLWYEDEYSKPIGRIECNYINNNSDKDEAYASVDVVSHYNAMDYSIYSVSENILIKNNKYTEAQIIELLSGMAENVKGISFMPMELSMIGRPDIEAGDVFDVVLNDGNFFKGFVERRTLSGINSLLDSIVSEDEYASIVSGTSSKSGNIIFPTGSSSVVLWENPSPTASFASQTVTLDDDISNYEYIGFIFARGSSNAENRSMVLPLLLVPVDSAFTGARMSIAGYRNYVRDVTAMSGNKVTFGGGVYYGTYGTNTTTASNTTLIPRYIIGFRK